MRDGRVSARIEKVTVRDDPDDYYTLEPAEQTDLSVFDVVHLRQDPPFDMGYITTTHLLERLHPRTLVVNDPAHVRNAPEKVFVTEFVDLMPPTLITRDRTGDYLPSATNTATSSSSHSTAMAAPASSGSPAATRTSPRSSRSSRTPTASPLLSSATSRKSARATSASSWSTAWLPAPSTVSRPLARRAPTCMSAAARNRSN